MHGFLSVLLTVLCLALLYYGVIAWYFIWWRPKSLERQLREQGVRGNPYKVLYGDLKEQMRTIKEEWSKPIALGHRQVAQRAIPFLHETIQKYGKASLMWNGTTPRVVLNDPEMMRDVLSDKSGLILKPPVNPLIKLLAMGLSSLEGEEWAARRKMINPAFHQEKLKAMLPAFSSSCVELISRWEKLVGADGTCELDIWPEFQRLTGDVISRTAFGSNYEEGRKIFQLQNEQVDLIIEASRTVYVPGFRFFPTKKNRRRMYLDKEIVSMLRNLIHKKRKSMEIRESGNDDLLGLLLKYSDYGNDENKAKKHRIKIEDVIEECKLFYFAGQETTSVWLTWTLIALAMHPEWQDRARDEVLQILGRRQPDFETINQLKTVTMILNEVFRLYPPVTGLFRYAPKGINLGDFKFPGGVEFWLPTIFIHHDQQHWGEDALEFNPDRFSGGISKASKDQNAFFPFGWGPRICLGQTFANIEAKIALAMILQHFSFELSPSYAHAPYTVITLQPQFGAQIFLRKLVN